MGEDAHAIMIGILAAITIVSYSAVQSNSKDSVVQTELSNFASKANVSKAETGGNGIHDPTTADFLSLGCTVGNKCEW